MADLKQIVEVLEPFSDAAEFYDAKTFGTFDSELVSEDANLSVGHLRAARNLLRTITEVGDEPKPQSVCMDCGGLNPVWFAPNALWNLVIGGPGAKDDPGGFYCPVCFIKRAESQGIKPTAWVLTEEAVTLEDLAQRARELLAAELGGDRGKRLLCGSPGSYLTVTGSQALRAITRALSPTVAVVEGEMVEAIERALDARDNEPAWASRLPTNREVAELAASAVKGVL